MNACLQGGSSLGPVVHDTTTIRLKLLSAFNLYQFSSLSGQFLNQDAKLVGAPEEYGKNLSNQPFPRAEGMPEAILKVKGRRVPVVWKQRKIYNGQAQVDCWFDRNNAAKLIDGVYKDYLASHPFDTESALGLSTPRKPETDRPHEESV
jgi:hypothetical protein